MQEDSNTKSNLILYLILRQLGANPKLQKCDGNKTVDIAIEEAKIHIEVDGVHHNKDSYQALSDLKRTYHDLQKGITTIRIPNSLVLTAQTGFNKPYGTYPYGAYKTEHNFFLFVPNPLNSALPNKQRVFAIRDNTESKVYKFSDFNGGNAVRDTFLDTEYLVVGDENLIVAFQINGSISSLNFTYDYQDTEIFFKDDEGNKWNMFGEAIEGPRTGQKMGSAKSVTSMWFAIAAFFPNPLIYSE